MYRRAGGTSGWRFLLGNGGLGVLRLRAHTGRPCGRGAIRRGGILTRRAADSRPYGGNKALYRRAGGTSGCRFLLGNGGLRVLRLRAHSVRPCGRGVIRRAESYTRRAADSRPYGGDRALHPRAGGTSGCRFLLGNGGVGMLRLRAHSVRPCGRGAIRRAGAYSRRADTRGDRLHGQPGTPCTLWGTPGCGMA